MVPFVVALFLLFGLSVAARVFLGISATTATVECRSRGRGGKRDSDR